LKVAIRSDGEFDMDAMMKQLFAAGISSVMVEGGARTYGSFVRAKKVQRLHVYQAPTAIGLELGLSWAGNFDEAEFMKHVKKERKQTEKFGVDTYWTAPVQFTHN
jgi:riboflavin biosynthesis pyrimidine reductase